MRAVYTWAVLGALVMGGAADARAEIVRRKAGSSTTREIVPIEGLYVGAGGVATFVLHQSGQPDLMRGGGGISAHLGFRAHPVLGVEVGWLGSLHAPDEEAFGADADLASLHGITADARVYPGGRATVEPYAQAGFGVYLVDDQVVGFDATGTGFHAGAGVDWAAFEHVAFGVRGVYRGLSMRPPDDTDRESVFVSAVSVEAGVALRF